MLTYTQLKRTFTWTIGGETLRFWRVVTPGHPNFGSDLSIIGLKEWGILRSSSMHFLGGK